MKFSKLNFEDKNIEIIRDFDFEFIAKLHSLSEKGKNLVFLLDEKYLDNKVVNLISGVITYRNVAEALTKKSPNLGLVASDNPKETFYKVYLHLYDNNFFSESFDSRISDKAIIHPKAYIASRNVVVGENTIIEEGVIVKENVVIGKNCLIQSGTILGNDCFETAIIDGKQQLIPHSGKLIIGNNVVIQSNCTISKGLFPTKNTYIDDEVIIADMVHIAHGVHIKYRSRIAAGVIIAGNTTIGSNVWIGPSAVISNGLTIGNNAFIAIGSVVVSNVADNQKVAGNFAIDFKTFKKFIGRIRIGN